MPEIIIKKYPNRRLYNTQISSYITNSDLIKLIKNNDNFKVVDSKSNADVTNAILVQIIFDQELKCYTLLPNQILRNIINYYCSMRNIMLPPHLNSFMKLFYSQASTENSANMIEKGLNMFYKAFGINLSDNV